MRISGVCFVNVQTCVQVSLFNHLYCSSFKKALGSYFLHSCDKQEPHFKICKVSFLSSL